MTLERLTAAATATALTIGLGCTAPQGRVEGAKPAASSGGGGVTLDHLAPARDSIGGTPSRFEWTPVEGADEYVIGVWTEVDVLVWRQDDLRQTSVARPADVELEPGTYFWSVLALRQDRPVADSGRSAFVVR